MNLNQCTENCCRAVVPNVLELDINKAGHQQYVGTWFPSFQGHPLISGAMPLESGAGFA